jgi:hypothetical protein
MNSSTSSEQTPASRPKILTVLCYLTMFASSWIMINSLTALMNPEQVSIAFSKELQNILDKCLRKAEEEKQEKQS